MTFQSERWTHRLLQKYGPWNSAKRICMLQNGPHPILPMTASLDSDKTKDDPWCHVTSCALSLPNRSHCHYSAPIPLLACSAATYHLQPPAERRSKGADGSARCPWSHHLWSMPLLLSSSHGIVSLDAEYCAFCCEVADIHVLCQVC